MINYKQQRGATLVIGLIMLAMITIAIVAGYNMTRTSLQIVGNLQSEEITVELANSAVEEALSTTRVSDAPGAVFLDPCNATANTRCYDINADGVDDVSVQLTPQPVCISAQILQNAQIDLTDPDEAGCVLSAQQNFGVFGSANQNSLCADSTWEITAVGTDTVTNTQQTIVAGAGIRVATNLIATFCP